MAARSCRLAAACLAAVLLLASCDVGVTHLVSDIRDTSALLNGEVWSKEGGTTNYWFEYGATAELGSRTPNAQAFVASPGSKTPVSARVSGLEEGTSYYYRTCSIDTHGGNGLCGATWSFTTSSGHDYVTGSGIVSEVPDIGYYDGSILDVQVNQDGSSPGGSMSVSPGSHYFRIPDEGPVTCVRVEGNQAVVGFIADATEYDPSLPLIPRLAFYEDNGTTGDRFFAQTLDTPADTCPDPDDIDQPGGVLIRGDFVVHDHPA